MTPEEHVQLEALAQKLLGDEQVATPLLTALTRGGYDVEVVEQHIKDYNLADDRVCRFRIGLDRDTVVIYRNPAFVVGPRPTFEPRN